MRKPDEEAKQQEVARKPAMPAMAGMARNGGNLRPTSYGSHPAIGSEDSALGEHTPPVSDAQGHVLLSRVHTPQPDT